MNENTTHPDVEIPEVMLPQPDQSIKITGVESEQSIEITGVETANYKV